MIGKQVLYSEHFTNENDYLLIQIEVFSHSIRIVFNSPSVLMSFDEYAFELMEITPENFMMQ